MRKILLIFLLFPFLAIAQHTIKGVFTPAENFKNALLYKITPTESVYMALSKIKEDGSFEFKTDSTYTKGIYKLIYAVPQEEHSFDIIYNGKEDIELKYSVDTGTEYLSSSENILATSYTKSMGMISQSINKYFREQSSDQEALKAIFDTQRNTQKQYEDAAKNTEIAIHFIKANKPYVPEQFKDVNTYIEELKAHYFDYVDFNSEVLRSSNFLIDRVFNYVLGMTSSHDQITTFKNNLDEAALKMQDANLLTKKTILEMLWQQFANAGYDEVANYISDKYLLQISRELNNKELEQQLLVFKNTSIGSIAPDFVVDEVSNIKLSDLNTSENYLIVFWSSTCGHCLEELPQLQKLINGLPENNFKVIAFAIEKDTVTWEKEKQKFLKFKHVVGLDKWHNKVARSYNVLSTPTYFLLDKNKTIIAKPENFEVLKKMFEN